MILFIAQTHVFLVLHHSPVPEGIRIPILDTPILLKRINETYRMGEYVGQKAKGHHDKPSTSIHADEAPLECRRRVEYKYG